ncbi:MAG: SH3 domain-containing protein [Candidatus Promineifilaceae bacterium]|nr:SH3 domain-containing protein [Candidatus Promineifilaceae bacterium]
MATLNPSQTRAKLHSRTLRWGATVLVALTVVALLSLLVTSTVAAQEDDSPFGADVVTATTLFNLNIRSGPGTEFERLDTLAAGTVVGFTGFVDGTGEWVQVDASDGPTGWVAARYLSNVPDDLAIRPADRPEEPATFSDDVFTARTTANLNVRSGPSLAADILDTLPAGSQVGFTGFRDAEGAWVQIDAAAGPTGWVSVNYLTSVPADLQVRPAEQPAEEAFSEDVVAAVTMVNLNIRSGPGLGFAILDTLEAGTTVGFTGFTDVTGDWVQVDAADGPTGWVAARFLSTVPNNLEVAP